MRNHLRISVCKPGDFFALLAAAIFFLSFASHVNAETVARARKTKTVIETTTSDAEGESVEDVDTALGDSTVEPKEKEITAKFGSKGMSGLSGCKTEEAAKDAINGLKDDCKAWIKDQRADLKGKYLTSSCEESCEDCGTSLKRCAVNGKVRYTVKIPK